MRLIEVEIWALKVIEAVRAGNPVEDARVELKATWPNDASKAARRLAGHANAARGESILWLIGVDEAGSVIGAPAEERSTWWAQVAARFADGVYPNLQDVVVHDNEGSVVALAFETGRAPYVVTVGQGGGVQFEVPWREATAVRTAKRSELLLMLAEAVSLPEVDVRWSSGDAVVREDATDLLELSVTVSCYFDAKPGIALVFPFYRCRGTVSADPGSWSELELSSITMRAGVANSPHVGYTADDLSLTGPASVVVAGFGKIPVPADDPVGDLRLVAELWATRSDIPVRLDTMIPFRGEMRPTDVVSRGWRWSSRDE